ncbi:class I SAM-dependent methyltransferase [Xylophilus sp. GOD-11R]|uniref:class I SAM-dependent methyltransferase n=1 Tax=Xylophilus sp. GOD-11R TaxID=3089814 RepID=UPI00298D2C01|nr:methyltransferase domain-containing protein [Xylophilus sp. GOD-11R]WPB58763.1 methyltransferase domain-containing protein [Xylophilus sp. GOD-11R]
MQSAETSSLQSWFATPAGQYLLAWEQSRFDAAVDDIFGYHGVQLGLPALDGLASSRVRRTWLAVDGSHATATGERTAVGGAHALVTDFSALPFDTASLDMVLMPHTLDLATDPHAALREAERVLVPDGKLVICGFNPASLWGVAQRRADLFGRIGLGQRFLPVRQDSIGYRRLRDWLRLLSFEVESSQFGGFRPAVRSQQWLDRFRWMDTAGDRWWPILGAAYFMVSTKRVAGMRLIAPAWKSRPARKEPAAVPVAGRDNVARHAPSPVPRPRPSSSYPDS